MYIPFGLYCRSRNSVVFLGLDPDLNLAKHVSWRPGQIADGNVEAASAGLTLALSVISHVLEVS